MHEQEHRGIGSRVRPIKYPAVCTPDDLQPATKRFHFSEESATIPVEEGIERQCDAQCKKWCIAATGGGVDPGAEIFGQFAEEWCDRASGLSTDAALIGRLIRRDEEALAALYDRHAGMMYAVLLRILKDSGAAEEVLQDVFLELWKRAERFDAGRGTLLAWLLVMGRSRALSRLRVTRRRYDLEAAEALPLETMASRDDLESKIARLRLMERLRAALRSLPPKQKEAVELAYFEGLTQTEIAARTGSPLGTVKSRVRVALQTLRGLVSGIAL